MKCRLGHVTNSSSSSFIISNDKVDRDKLIEILLEIANKEHRCENDDPDYTLEDDVTKDCVAYRYHIKKATKKHPLDRNGYEWNKYSGSEPYDNHWFIDNDDCGRYDWDVIEEVLSKYGIEWEHGYCN